MITAIKRFILVAALAGASVSGTVCLAAENPRVLTSLVSVHSLTNDEAARSIPVAFEASVTYYQKKNIDLFVQDGDAAIYVETPPDMGLTTGDRVLVEGTTRASFRPEILAKRVTVLHHGLPPPPVKAEFGSLIHAELDCRRATVRALVRAANVTSDGSGKSVVLDLLLPGGPLQAQIAEGGTPDDLNALLDTTIEITGAVAGRFDSKNQMTGIVLEVPSFSDLRIVAPARVKPHEVPLRPFNEILQATQVEDRTERVRVQGTITYFQPGSALVLQDGDRALWVDTGTEDPHNVGDQATVSGFPDVRNGSLVITGAEVVSAPARLPLPVAQLDIAQLASGTHAFELVAVEGELLTRVREAAQDQYVITAQGHVFSAIYRYPERGLNIPPSPMRDIRLGSRVRVTGICVLDRGDQFRGRVAFHLLIRSSEDVALVAGPSPISVRNLVIVLVLLLIVVFLAVGRAWLVERTLHRRNIATLSAVERWRTRVIDGINRAAPLPETMLQITELVSFNLQAEYCWAEIEGHDSFGNRPSPADTKLQIFERIIPAHSGEALGKICVAFPASTRRSRLAPDALENAVRLASLAIETGSRYSDLVRRSELDPLTKAHNRLGFDGALGQAMEKARTAGARCGLIYIDLDEFKRVNDEFGHHIGDCYLQEIVSRFGRQIRPGDTLARIGGDEFCVIIERVNGAPELEEIASRLQGCFDTVFSLEKSQIRGSASIGCAVYPDDATSAEALLERADARMYVGKREKTGLILTPGDSPAITRETPHH